MNRRVRAGSAASGLAMIAVLLVLLALLVLCAPFLLTVSNADRASARIADRASGLVALDSAQRLARARLGASHRGLDATPYSDGADEIAVETTFAPEFLDPRDPQGVMWDLDVADEAGKVDLSSASPHVIANLLGCVGRLRKEVDEKAKELPVGSVSGFASEGFVWLGAELVGYTRAEESTLGGLVRGLGSRVDEDGTPLPCGPQPASPHPLGAFVVDQRAWAIPRWRIDVRGTEPRGFSAVEDVAEAADHALAETLGEGALATLERTASVHGGVAAGPIWQHGTRLTVDLDGGPEACKLVVDEARWFNAGTTVLIVDGAARELALVRANTGRQLILADALVNDYRAHRAVVTPLARRPVNVNTASPEVLRALFLNLKLRGRSPRITAAQAADLSEIVLASRPFEGFEDFVRRVVFPSAGLEPLPEDAPVVPEAFRVHTGLGDGAAPAGFLEPDDAIALYKNALNANDAELEYATMPFSFTTRDVYALSMRASVNQRSGVERVRAVRDVVELVVPQRELLTAFARQEDFDLALRLTRDAAGWISGPEVTTRFDPLYGADPPSRARTHLGPWDSGANDGRGGGRTNDPTRMPGVQAGPPPDTPAYVFARRDDAGGGSGRRRGSEPGGEPGGEEGGWIQPAPTRESEWGRPGKVVHFDGETRSAEGRYLPDGPLVADPSSRLVDWVDASDLTRPLTLSMWIRPRAVEPGARFLDLGGSFDDSDRVSLLFDEQGDLVLRVLDAAPDHPRTPFEEVMEVRYPAAEGPGLPPDTWMHVQVDVRGNRPDQTTLLVDGRMAAETTGLTRLTATIPWDAERIPVESTDGFPDRAVLRIGNELIEARKSSVTEFETSFRASEGYGGRLARHLFRGSPPSNVGVGGAISYPAGTAVRLYGYSLILEQDLPSAAGRLPDDLGAFAVARVIGTVVRNEELTENRMQAINVLVPSTQNPGELVTVTVGRGMRARNTEVQSLVLEPVELENEAYMEAFNRGGGYAILVGIDWRGNRGPDDVNGDPIGGIEVIRYSGWDGRHLHLDLRGDEVDLVRLREAVLDELHERASWIFAWRNEPFSWAPRGDLRAQTKIVPISIPVGAAGGSPFPDPALGNGDPSSFVQITDASPELTEWVRYDEIAGGQLVRDDPAALDAAYDACTLDWEPAGDDLDPDPGPNRREPGGDGGGEGRAAGAPAPGPAPGPEPQVGQEVFPFAWSNEIGEIEDEDFFVTRAVRTAFQFRGVLGTFSHAHVAGTPVLPVWKAFDQHGIEGGWPGTGDPVALVLGAQLGGGVPGTEGVVRHAHRPLEYLVSGWLEAGLLNPQDGGEVDRRQDPFLLGSTFVALEEPASLPIPGGASAATGTSVDSRQFGRVLKFPSGERPRAVTEMAVGGDFRGAGDVPAALVDEVVFSDPQFGRGLSDAAAGASLQLADPLWAGGSTTELVDHSLIIPGGHAPGNPGVLAELPGDAGLLRIGEEILCYGSVDEGSGTLVVAPGGRGLLGTDELDHPQGEPVTFLEEPRVTLLISGIGPDDSALPVAETNDFPRSGTVLVGRELVHYTWIAGNDLIMPRSSREPGAADGEGRGIFRGRFGTTAVAHAAGTPVIVFPVRYRDGWSEVADAPELACFGLHLDQPDAVWLTTFFDVEQVDGPRLGVLQRTDPTVPWDTPPDESDALTLLFEGMPGGEGNPVVERSERIEWRVFVRHEPGSFDPITGLSHGWKRVPRLMLLGASYLAPGRTLRRVER